MQEAAGKQQCCCAAKHHAAALQSLQELSVTLQLADILPQPRAVADVVLSFLVLLLVDQVPQHQVLQGAYKACILLSHIHSWLLLRVLQAAQSLQHP